ncbi:MAG TPA: ATP synthase subunit C [Caldimonas sp.]|jgi:V/A-type H+-transporting ATPase subunit K
MKQPQKLPLSLIGLVLLLGSASTALLLAAPHAMAASDAPVIAKSLADAGWLFIAAALATGLSALGAGFAVARIGTAAVGALAEKPDLFGRLLIFIGLAEGIAIYGLIVSILILNRLG